MHSKSRVTMISNDDFNTSLRGFWSMDKIKSRAAVKTEIDNKMEVDTT